MNIITVIAAAILIVGCAFVFWTVPPFLPDPSLPRQLPCPANYNPPE